MPPILSLLFNTNCKPLNTIFSVVNFNLTNPGLVVWLGLTYGFMLNNILITLLL